LIETVLLLPGLSQSESNLVNANASRSIDWFDVSFRQLLMGPNPNFFIVFFIGLFFSGVENLFHDASQLKLPCVYNKRSCFTFIL
jgi:hypothetical protein